MFSALCKSSSCSVRGCFSRSVTPLCSLTHSPLCSSKFAQGHHHLTVFCGAGSNTVYFMFDRWLCVITSGCPCFFFYIMRATDYVNGKSEHTRIWKPRFLKMKLEVHFVNLTHLSFFFFSVLHSPVETQPPLFWHLKFFVSRSKCLLTLKKKASQI